MAFGYLTTAYLVGLAVSPVVAGLDRIAQHARGVFLRCASGSAVLAWAMRGRMSETVVVVPGVTVDRWSCGHRRVCAGAAVAASGGIVAFPTDTFYGLAVDPTSSGAVRGAVRAEGPRSASAALPLVAASAEQVETCLWRARTRDAARLASAFWPGPLSLILDAPPASMPRVHAGHGHGRDSRAGSSGRARAGGGVRARPITATSANRSGEPPARVGARARSRRSTARVFVIDGGPTPGGAPSTIVDARAAPPRLVRDGRDRVGPRARIARKNEQRAALGRTSRHWNVRRSSDWSRAPRRSVDPDIILDELAGLARAAGAEVVLRVVQERALPDPATFIGRGKAETLALGAATRRTPRSSSSTTS